MGTECVERFVHTIAKELRPLVRAATAAGWRIRQTRRGHLVWYDPTGAAFTTGSKMDEPRALANVRAGLRRRGLAVP